MNKKLEKITKVRLPYDRRAPEPTKNYGINGLDIWFILKGPKGAVQYAVSFGIYLPHVQSELDRKDKGYTGRIRGFDVGYHSIEQKFEGQTQMDCDHFDKCYYDGSALRSDSWTEEIFSVTGKHPEEVLWKMLEVEYVERFGEL